MDRITGIDHVVLVVADTERSVEWYGRLGLEPDRLEQWRAGEVLFASVRVGPDVIIDLFEGPVGEPFDHLCLVVETDDLAGFLAERGFEPQASPQLLYGARGVGWSVYLTDPDGHRIEVRSYRDQRDRPGGGTAAG